MPQAGFTNQTAYISYRNNSYFGAYVDNRISNFLGNISEDLQVKIQIVKNKCEIYDNIVSLFPIVDFVESYIYFYKTKF